MTFAPSLFDARGSIDERFEAFDRSNPHVFKEFKRLAEQLLRAGWDHYSADALCHRIRVDHDLRIEKGGERFRMNDHYSSRLARKLMAEDARFSGFFELRRLRARQGGAA